MIVCCGEALIDMIPEATPNGDAFLPKPGGAIFNTAIGLGRLGVPCGFLSGVSTDLFGRILSDALEASGVQAGAVIASQRPTTLAFVTLVNGQARYAFYDENTAGRMLDPDHLPDIGDAVTALYFGGISLISEPAATFYERLALREAGHRLIMLDPNIRASFVSDEPAYRARLDRMIGVADIVKVSDEDLQWILPDASDLESGAKTLQAEGPKIVIVTRGQEGAVAFGPNGMRVSAPATRVTVVDTVGAGDTFNSGVLASLWHARALSRTTLPEVTEQALREALEYGAAVAAVTVSRAGANPPWRDDIAIPAGETL